MAVGSVGQGFRAGVVGTTLSAPQWWVFSWNVYLPGCDSGGWGLGQLRPDGSFPRLLLYPHIWRWVLSIWSQGWTGRNLSARLLGKVSPSGLGFSQLGTEDLPDSASSEILNRGPLAHSDQTSKATRHCCVYTVFLREVIGPPRFKVRDCRPHLSVEGELKNSEAVFYNHNQMF